MINTDFGLTIEVVPPAGPDAQALLRALAQIAHLPFDGFSVATNPVAKPRMSALALGSLIQQQTGRPATLHCTTRDHNRLSLQGELWGARALGIESVLIATGDMVALKEQGRTTTVRDVDLFDLVGMAREAGLRTGVVFDHHPEVAGLDLAVQRLDKKIAAGAQFAVTQPVYAAADIEMLSQALSRFKIPIMLGILPLRTPRHAEFLDQKVAGIAVPVEIRERMRQATDPVIEGVRIARDVLAMARQRFAGACLMPPFDHYEILAEIIA
jgi:methylenetetrahydrofolate reductase (NADPH)